MTPKQRLHKIKHIGCIVCELFLGIDDSPSDIHHLTDARGRLGDEYTIPLCPEHHRIGKYSVAVCHGRKKFTDAYMSELELLKIVNQKISCK